MIVACTRYGGRALIAVAVLIGASQSVSAQTQARVVRNQSIVWTLSMPTPITTVNAGTVLEVTGRIGDFYVVRLPALGGRPASSGRIAISQVEIIQGTPPTEPPPLADVLTSARRSERGVGVFAFGTAGVSTWLAHDTFSAVLGSDRTPMFGVGGQVRVHGQLVIEGAIERLTKTGQRVFVSGGEVFKLGIRDTVRIVPISVTALYRQPAQRVAYYGGGGVGRYSYKEDSDFADPGENTNQRFASYHVVAGVEFDALTSMLKTAVEVQFTSVPNALGTSGASAVFGERNLGGVQLRVKILVGR